MISLEGIDSKMIANNLEPFEPTHPGSILKEELEFRGITPTHFAEQTGISNSELNDLLNSKCPITTEYAMLIEAALDIEATFWIRMQADYDLTMAKRNKSFMEKLKQVRKMAAVW